MSQPTLENRVKSLEYRTTRTEAGLIQISKEIKQGHLEIGKALDSHADGIMEEIRKRAEPIERRLKPNREATQPNRSKSRCRDRYAEGNYGEAAS